MEEILNCPFFGKCGGCVFEDLDETYTHKKETALKEALAHKAIDIIPEPLIRIPKESRRRATFAFANGHFGFNEMQSHRIVDISSCAVLTPQLSTFIPSLRTFMKNFKTKGDVFVLMTEFGADIKIDENKKTPTSLDLLEKISAFCQENTVARFVLNNEPIYQATQLPFPSGAFMQPSLEGEKALQKLVLESVGDGSKVVDLFCGLGTFTKPLAAAGKKTEGYDSASDSIETLKKSGIQAFSRDLFRNPLTPEELNRFDVAVLDPARAGAFEQCEMLAQSDISKIVMVSCHIGTFCRDARILINAGFKLDKLTPVDQFVATRHLEVVAVFCKNFT